MNNPSPTTMKEMRYVDFDGYHAHTTGSDLYVGKGSKENCKECQPSEEKEVA